MATPKQVRAWLDQATADLAASGIEADDVRECHRRYWIQQSYEKAIKAYALTRWTGSAADEGELARLFLLQHSPLKAVSQANTPLSKALRLLSREVEAFVRGFDNADMLLRIDATTPSSEPADVSYRYPFIVDGEYLAPAAYEAWDTYQGNIAGARAVVGRLLNAVKEELRIFARAPK